MPVLTAVEARSEYQSTLNTIANTAIFQYTFVAAVVYVALAAGGLEYRLIGFRFSKLAWGFVAVLGSAAINLYVGRLLSYLDTLARMHPQQRRVLRFLTRHHRWFLNPYRVVFPPGRLMLANSVMYMAFVGVLFQVPLEVMLADVPMRWPIFTMWSLAVFWWFGSILYILARMSQLGNTLWRGRYSPPDRRPAKSGTMLGTMD